MFSSLIPRPRFGLNGSSTDIERLRNFSSGATIVMSTRAPPSARSASQPQPRSQQADGQALGGQVGRARR